MWLVKFLIIVGAVNDPKIARGAGNGGDGDEFTILLEGITDPSDAMRVAQRILLALAKPLLVEGQKCAPQPA